MPQVRNINQFSSFAATQFVRALESSVWHIQKEVTEESEALALCGWATSRRMFTPWTERIGEELSPSQRVCGKCLKQYER